MVQRGRIFGYFRKIKEGFIEGQHEVVAPDLVLYKMANAMRYSKNFDTELTKESFESLINLGIDIVTPTRNLLNTAIDLSNQHDITLYDAVFLSLAKLIEGRFITADEKLYRKTKDFEFVKFISDFE